MSLLDHIKHTMEKTIRIECQGATIVELDELTDLQGRLKTLMDEDYEKLRKSIETLGFSFPVFFWEDETGRKWIIDAHQRVRTLKQMRSEGYTIPPLPADRIFATNRAEAKKKLLAQISRYGKVTEEGMTDFVNEEGFEIDMEEMDDMLTFPEIDFGPEEDSTPKVNLDENKDACEACQKYHNANHQAS